MKQIFVLSIIFLSSVTFSQGLELSTLLKMADTANPTLKNAQIDIQANAFQKKAFLSTRLPQLSAVGDYKYNAIIPGQIVPADFFGGPPGTFAQVKFGVPYNLNNSILLTQFLFNPQLSYGLAALAINEEVVNIQYRAAQQEVKTQIANAYFSLQAVKKQLQFLDLNEVNVSGLIKNMELLNQQGLVVSTEVDKLRINKITIINSKQKLKNTQTQLEILIKILTGMKPDSELKLADDEVIQRTILVDETTVFRPELQLLDQQRKMNIEENKGTRMAYLPTLSFYASYNYNYNMKPEDDFRAGIESAFLGLRLDISLFDGFQKMNKLKVNALNKTKLENQEMLVKEQLELSTQNAKREIDIQASSLELSQEQLVLAQNIFEASQAQFTAGTISTNELIQSDNALQQAQSNVVSAYIQLRQAELTYLKSIGNIK